MKVLMSEAAFNFTEETNSQFEDLLALLKCRAKTGPCPGITSRVNDLGDTTWQSL